MAAPDTKLTQLQVAAVEGFLQQMAIMGVAPDDPEETPRTAYLALCAGTVWWWRAIWAITWAKLKGGSS